jgi:hypothetical protein
MSVIKLSSKHEKMRSPALHAGRRDWLRRIGAGGRRSNNEITGCTMKGRGDARTGQLERLLGWRIDDPV